MKSAKLPSADAPPNRRSQPVRQTRTNPRASGQRGSLGGRDGLGGGPTQDQPIDIFPAITHFADAITALPKELVRHFTLLKEVDAKIFVPEEGLFQLVDAAMNARPPEPRPMNDSSSSVVLGSTPMSAQNSSSGIVLGNSVQPVPSIDGSYAPSVFDPSNLPRRQLFRQTAMKIQEMLVSLEEKNHVICAANDALQKQLARIDDVWPHLEGEFSDEAKWGSTTHWAYPENRAGKAGQAERSRREGAAAISAAAQQLADEAAARSDARKQAVQAKKNLKTQHQESDFDDPEARNKAEAGKKGQGAAKVRKATEAAANVGLGISTNGSVKTNPAPKRRKVEKPPSNTLPTERAMASVFGPSAPKTKPTSPRETPAPEGTKKRKALPTGTGQSKKSKTGVGAMSPSATSSPVLSAFPDVKAPRASPAPSVARAAVVSRARQNSTQSTAENAKPRPSSSASNKPNGAPPSTPDLAPPANWPRAPPVVETKVAEKPVLPAKPETLKKDAEVPETVETVGTIINATANKKEATKVEEPERKSEPAPPPPVLTTTITTVTKSGRASKPSTPALATFQEAARSRSARNAEHHSSNKRKKSNAAAQALAAKLADEDANSSMQGDDEDAEIDADEPTYCYCNSVSYGEMVACDGEGCEREWFHLECVGLKIAPKGNAKWFCEDCKERLKAGGKKVNGR